jgi:FkbM family methyltransferase
MNILRNGLDGMIIPINAAVGGHHENLSIGSLPESNMGTTAMKKDATGEITITLDSFQFQEDRVDFMKIDVEDFECNVLKGGIRLVREYDAPPMLSEIGSVQTENGRGNAGWTWISIDLGIPGYRLSIPPQVCFEHD